jgi:hypothetical protein
MADEEQGFLHFRREGRCKTPLRCAVVTCTASRRTVPLLLASTGHGSNAGHSTTGCLFFTPDRTSIQRIHRGRKLGVVEAHLKAVVTQADFDTSYISIIRAAAEGLCSTQAAVSHVWLENMQLTRTHWALL